MQSTEPCGTIHCKKLRTKNVKGDHIRQDEGVRVAGRAQCREQEEKCWCLLILQLLSSLVFVVVQFLFQAVCYEEGADEVFH